MKYGGRGLTVKCQEETSGMMDMFNKVITRGSDYAAVYICQNLSNIPFKMDEFYSTSIILPKKVTKNIN